MCHDVAEAEVPDLATADQVIEGAQYLFQGRRCVENVHLPTAPL